MVRAGRRLTGAGYRVITYDRRGFGESDKPETGYTYDEFAADLAGLLDGLDLRDVSLVGFSMGGGEIARYIGRYGEDRLHSVVFAAAVPPYLLKTDDNPDGGLGEEDVEGMQQQARDDREAFLDGFMTDFFSADGELKVTEAQRQEALALADAGAQRGGRRLHRGVRHDRLPCRPREGHRADAGHPRRRRRHRAPRGVGQADRRGHRGQHPRRRGGRPHGFNVSHAEKLNRELIDFLAR